MGDGDGEAPEAHTAGGWADAAVSGRRPCFSKKVEDGPSRLPSGLLVNSHLNVPVLLAFFAMETTRQQREQYRDLGCTALEFCMRYRIRASKLQRKHADKF